MFRLIESERASSNLVRLRPSQAKAIRDTVTRVVYPDTRVSPFGSRVDDALRGGDIK